MNGLQFGNDENVDIGGGNPILKMKSHSLANILVEFVDGLALREDIFADSSRAPKVTVVVDLNFYEHNVILQRVRGLSHSCFWF